MKRIKRLVAAGKRKVEELSEKDCFELALLIDTEGSIDTCHQNRPHIKVGMSSTLPVKIYTNWDRGTIYKEKKRGKKLFYDWNVDKQSQIREILEKIKPHLQIKQQQAKLALQMLNILDNKKEGYKEKLKQIAVEIHRLNRTEPPDYDWIPYPTKRSVECGKTVTP